VTILVHVKTYFFKAVSPAYINYRKGLGEGDTTLHLPVHRAAAA